MSLVTEIKQNTVGLGSKYIVILFVCLGLGGIGWYGYGQYMKQDTAQEIVPQLSEALVKKGNIVISTKANGTVQGNNTTVLGFDVNGKITHIYKHVGESVYPGEKLAQIDASDLYLELQKAQNSFRQAQLTYQKNINPLSHEEKLQLNQELDLTALSYEQQITKLQSEIIANEQSIVQAQKKVKQIQENMYNTTGDNSFQLQKDIEDQSFLQKQKELYTSFFDIILKTKEFVVKVDQFMGFSENNDILNDIYESNISARNSFYKEKAYALRQNIQTLLSHTSNLQYQNYDILLSDVQTIQKLLSSTKELTILMQDICDASVAGASLTQEQISTWKSSFLGYASSIATYDKSLFTALESLKGMQLSTKNVLTNSMTSLEDKIIGLQQQLDSATQDLNFAQQQYDNNKKILNQTKQYSDKNLAKAFLDNRIKSNPLSMQEKSLFDAQVAASRLVVIEKQKTIQEATLVSPVSGVVLAINGNIGQPSNNQLMTIGTNGYRYVQVSIDEDEIDKIKVGQAVSIKPEAVSDLYITGTVYYVANAGVIDNNGIVTFDVFVSFYTEDDRLKTAMNVEVSFIQKTVQNVLILPVKAVYPYDNAPHVTLENNTRRKVITGLSDGKIVEIISGLTEGEKVIY